MGRAGQRQRVIAVQRSGQHNRFGTSIALLTLACGHHVLRRQVRAAANCGHCGSAAGGPE